MMVAAAAGSGVAAVAAAALVAAAAAALNCFLGAMMVEQGLQRLPANFRVRTRRTSNFIDLGVGDCAK